MRDENVVRLSPLIHDHINMLGRYSFAMPDIVARRGLRPLFDPNDRYAEADFPSNCSKDPYTYFPFGGGSRQCIGEAFAWMEGTLSLATLAQRWKPRFVPTYPIELQPKITLRPKHPVMMRLEPR